MPSTKRITLALVLSLAAHGLVFALWENETHDIQVGGQAMTVTLVVHANKALQSSTQKTSPTKSPISKPENIQAIRKPIEKALPTTKKVKIAMHAEQQAELPKRKPSHSDTNKIKHNSFEHKKIEKSNADKSIENNLRLKSILRKAFNAHFYYPKLAIRRGWQGEVQLGIHIEANGSLSHVRILQGSGYTLLDKAAIKSLNKVKVLPEAIALLNGRELNLILPIQYLLL